MRVSYQASRMSSLSHEVRGFAVEPTENKQMIGITFVLKAVIALGTPNLGKVTELAAPQIDATSVARAYIEKLKSAQTATGTYTIRSAGRQNFTGKVDFALSKDNQMWLNSRTTSEHFNGTTHILVDKLRETYRVRDPRVFGVPYLAGFEPFLKLNNSPLLKSIVATNSTVSQFEDQDLVALRFGNQTNYIDPVSKDVVAVVRQTEGSVVTYRFSNIDFNRRVDVSNFGFSSPASFKLVPNTSTSLIEIGSSAPTQESEVQSRLSKAIADRDLTLLIFANNNAPSIDLIKKVQTWSPSLSQKVTPVVVTNVRKQADLAKSYRGLQFILDSSMSSESLLQVYGANLFPTVYLLDRDGKVLYRQIDGNEFLLQEALEANGVRFP